MHYKVCKNSIINYVKITLLLIIHSRTMPEDKHLIEGHCSGNTQTQPLSIRSLLGFKYIRPAEEEDKTCN